MESVVNETSVATNLFDIYFLKSKPDVQMCDSTVWLNSDMLITNAEVFRYSLTTFKAGLYQGGLEFI